MPDAPEPPPTDELAHELRRLGYLESRVDRYLGRGARGTRGPVSIAFRVGSLGMIPVGAVLFGFHALADPLVLADGVRAALLLGVVLVGSLVLVSLVALALQRMAGHGLSGGAREVLAWFGSLLVTTNLGASWWHLRVTVGEGSARLNGDLIVAVVVVTLLVVLARVFALSEAAAGGAPLPGRRPVLRWLYGAGLISIVALRFLLPSPGDPAPPPEEFTARGTGVKVVWVIIDGLSPSLYDRAVEARWMPALERRAGDSIPVTLLIGDGSPTPAELWTTATTGAPASRHGVHRFARTRVTWNQREAVGVWLGRALFPFLVPLETTPLSAKERRVPTLGEIVASRSYRVVSVNGWCTGPATPGADIWLASDRAIRAALVEPSPAAKDSEVVPDAAREALAAVFESLGGRTPGKPRPRPDPLVLSIAERLAAGLFKERGREPDLITVTLSGTDLALLGSADDTELETHLRSLDSVLETFLSRLGMDHAVVISAARGGRDRDEPAENGWVLLAGAPFERATSATLRTVDLVPLVLHVLGFPRPADLPGEVPTRLLTAEFLDANPVREIPGYGERDRSRIADTLGDERRHLETLKTLGYLGASRW